MNMVVIFYLGHLLMAVRTAVVPGVGVRCCVHSGVVGKYLSTSYVPLGEHILLPPRARKV